MDPNPFFLSGFVVAGFGASLAAQQVDVVYVERYASYHQQSESTIVPSQIYDDYLWVTAAAEISSGSISDLALSNGLVTLEIPLAEANVYEAEESFDSVAEMNMVLQPGQYTISGTGSTEGAFDLQFTLPETEFFPAKKVTNYELLQNTIPDVPLSIDWELFREALTPTGGFIQVTVGFWDGNNRVVVWESPDEQEGVLPGLPPTVTTVMMPPNVLRGSPNGVYTVSLVFGKVDNLIDDPGPFDGGVLATLVSVETHFDIQVFSDIETWGAWMDEDLDNWINTEDYLGWVFIGSTGWVAPQKLGWIYLPEEYLRPEGAWSYLPR